MMAPLLPLWRTLGSVYARGALLLGLGLVGLCGAALARPVSGAPDAIEELPELPSTPSAAQSGSSPIRFRIFQIDRNVDLQGRSLTAPREVYLRASEEVEVSEWLGQRLQVYRKVPLPNGELSNDAELPADIAELDELAGDDAAGLPELDELATMERVVGELAILSVNGMILHARVTRDDLSSPRRRESGSERGVVMIGDFARLIPPPPVTAPPPRVRRRRETPSPFQRENMRWRL